MKVGRKKNPPKNFKQQFSVLRLALKDPRTPWYAKLIVVLVIAYILSPIDLIPDFIPVLGQLDDLVVVPLGLFLAAKLVPKPLMVELQQQAILLEAPKPSGAGAPVRRKERLKWIVLAVVLVALLLALGFWFTFKT